MVLVKSLSCCGYGIRFMYILYFSLYYLHIYLFQNVVMHNHKINAFVVRQCCDYCIGLQSLHLKILI